jgi:hypothetical protein
MGRMTDRLTADVLNVILILTCARNIISKNSIIFKLETSAEYGHEIQKTGNNYTTNQEQRIRCACCLMIINDIIYYLETPDNMQCDNISINTNIEK